MQAPYAKINSPNDISHSNRGRSLAASDTALGTTFHPSVDKLFVQSFLKAQSGLNQEEYFKVKIVADTLRTIEYLRPRKGVGGARKRLDRSCGEASIYDKRNYYATAWHRKEDLEDRMTLNFSNGDPFITLTTAKNMPRNEFSKAMSAFFRKLKKRYGDIKYIAVKQFQGRNVLHAHIVCNVRNIAKANIEALWSHGNVSNVESIKNISAITNYLSKQLNEPRFKGKQPVTYSRNLKNAPTYCNKSADPKEARIANEIKRAAKKVTPKDMRQYPASHVGNITKSTYNTSDFDNILSGDILFPARATQSSAKPPKADQNYIEKNREHMIPEHLFPQELHIRIGEQQRHNLSAFKSHLLNHPGGLKVCLHVADRSGKKCIVETFFLANTLQQDVIRDVLEVNKADMWLSSSAEQAKAQIISCFPRTLRQFPHLILLPKTGKRRRITTIRENGFT